MNLFFLDASRWLWDFFLLATLLLATVLVLNKIIVQPARRMAIHWSAAAGLFLLALMCAVPGWSVVHMISAPVEPPAIELAEVEPIAELAINSDESMTTPTLPFPMMAPLVGNDFSAASAEVEATTSEPIPVETASLATPMNYGLWSLALAGSGATFVLLWLMAGTWQVRRLRAEAQPAPPQLTDLLAKLANNKRAPELGVAKNLSVAVAVGLQQPMVLLPKTFLELTSPEKTKTVLAHELAHIRHRDLWLLALLRGLLLILWPHPLFWLWRRSVRLDQETLADAAASEVTSRTDYAEQLVAWARVATNARAPRLASSVGLWESPSQLKRRIAILLDEKLTVLRACSRQWRVACGTSAVIAAVMLSLVTIQPATNAAEENKPLENNTKNNQADEATSYQAPLEFIQFALDNDVISKRKNNQAAITKQLTNKLVVHSAYRFDAKNILSRISPAYDKLAGHDHAFMHLLQGLEKDPYGPKINVEDEVVSILTGEAAFITFKQAAEQQAPEHWLIAIQTNNDKKLAATLDRFMRVEHEALRIPLAKQHLWKFTSEQGEELYAGVELGHLLCSNHLPLLLELLSEEAAAEKLEALAQAGTSTVEEKESSQPADDVDDDTQAKLSGHIVFEDGSPATVKGWLYSDSERHSKNTTSGYYNTIDQFIDTFKCEVQAGTVVLSYFPEGYAPVWTDPMEIKPGEVREGLKLVLKSGFSCVVRVFNEQGEPIIGATLIANPEINDSVGGPVSEKTTNKKGEYTLEHLAATRYEFGITAPGYQPLSTTPLRVAAGEVLNLTMVRSHPTTGVVRFADGTPASGAKLRCKFEIRENGRNAMYSSQDKGFWGETLTTCDTSGRFQLGQLRDGSRYLFVVEAADSARVIVHSLQAGQENMQIVLPLRRDLVIKIKGEISKLDKSKSFVSVRQRVHSLIKPGHRQGHLLGDSVTIEPWEDGGRAVFRGLAVDPASPDAGKQQVEVTLGYDRTTMKKVDLNLTGQTVVEFELPQSPPAHSSRFEVRDVDRIPSGTDIAALLKKNTNLVLAEWADPQEAVANLTYDKTRSSLLLSSDIASAVVKPAEHDKRSYDILIELTPAAGKRFKQATQKLIGSRLAIMVDGKIVMAPRLHAVLSSEFVITGNFNKKQAEEIAQTLLQPDKLTSANEKTSSPKQATNNRTKPNKLAPLANASLRTDEAHEQFRDHSKRLHQLREPNTLRGLCVDENSKPLPGVLITVRLKQSASTKPSQLKQLHQVKTDEKGEFLIAQVLDIAAEYPEGLPKNDAFTNDLQVLPITATLDGRVTQTNGDMAHRVAKNGGVLVWTMQPAQALRGRITDEEGKPLAGARVYYGRHGMNMSSPYPDINTAITNKKGEYNINDLDHYDLRNEPKNAVYPLPQPTLFVSHPKYATQFETITAVPGSVDCQLTHRKKVSLRSEGDTTDTPNGNTQ